MNLAPYRGCSNYQCLVMAVALLANPFVAIAGEPVFPGAPVLTILYSAEAHGALLPCNCPVQPLGGIARRATLIKRYRQRGPVLLVDAGGWPAGGIYDEQSDGDPAHDAMRTDLMCRALKLMNYDMVCADDNTGNMLRTQFACVARNYQTNVLTGTGGLIHFTIDEIADEKTGLWVNTSLAVNQNAPKTEIPKIILSRMGEEASSTIAASQTAQSLVINAGRKNTSRLSWHSGNSTVANFDYQTERLGVVEIYATGASTGPQFEFRVRAEALNAEIPDDPDMVTLLKPFMQSLQKTGKQKVQVEFWTMPECPGCLTARPEIERIRDELGNRAAVTVHFVIQSENGQWRSLHGPRELNEARIQAIVQKYYPEKIFKWMAWREQHMEAPIEEGANACGILAARIRGALVSGMGDALLAADHELMLKRTITGTPSLIIANRMYDNSIERIQLLRVICGLLESPKPDVCKDVPACFFDAQCRKRGFIGHCVDAGKAAAHCETSREAIKVSATVVVDQTALNDNHEHIMELLVDDLPGIDFKVVDIAEPGARELARKLKLLRLPAYIIDEAAKNESGYADTLGKAVVEDEQNKVLILQNFAVGSAQVLSRPRIKGRVDLFVSRLSKNGEEALEAALEYRKALGPSAPELVIHDILQWKESEVTASGAPAKRELAAPGGLAEVEEAARAFAVRKLAPEHFESYLIERGKRRGSSYWDAALRVAGIEPDKVRAQSEYPSDEILQCMYAEADLLKSLDAGGEIIFLAENCEIIPIRSHRELREMMEKIGPRK